MRYLSGALFVIFMLFVNYIEISGMNSNWKKTKTLRLFGQNLEVSEDPTESSDMKLKRKGYKSLRLAENGEIKIFNEHTQCFEEDPLPARRSYKRRATDKDRPTFQDYATNFQNNNELNGIPTYMPGIQQNGPYIHHNHRHPIVPMAHVHMPENLVGLEAYQLFQKYYANHPLPSESVQSAAYEVYQEHCNKYNLPPTFKGHSGASGSINYQN